ncbi:MAG: hypothetical protein ACR2M9_01460, partial [Cyanophyceae cyanobacterium]
VQGPAKVSATYDFKLRLTGEDTSFNPTPGPTIQPSTPTFNFDQAEFLHPTNMGIFIPRNPTYPIVPAGSPTLPTWATSQSNNHHFFYVMPKTGVVTGYTVNFCAMPYGINPAIGPFPPRRSRFGIGIASPSSFISDINIDIDLTPPNPNYSYSSAYYNLPTPKKISQGSYLGCFCHHPTSGFNGAHAQGDTHMTVHVVFDE